MREAILKLDYVEWVRAGRPRIAADLAPGCAATGCVFCLGLLKRLRSHG